MEIVVTISKIDELEIFKNVNSFLVVSKYYASLEYSSACTKRMTKIINQINANNKNAYVLIDRLMFDEDYDALKSFILKMEKLNVKGYYFADLGVYDLLCKMNLKDKAIYYSQTQIVSTMEGKEYFSLGMKGIFASRYLPFNKVKELAKDVSLGIKIFGYHNLFYSRRKLMTDFKEEFEMKGKYSESNLYTIKEMKRDVKNIIFENEFGTYIFTDYIENHFDELEELKNSGLRYALIDTNLLDQDLINELVKIIDDNSYQINSTKRIIDTYKVGE
jgi:collagenase-like PrtC family protease